MTGSLRILAAQLGRSLSDVGDAKPWSAEAVQTYAAKHGDRDEPLGYSHLPDVQIASAVRMLMRDDLDHESVVCAARDRICALHMEKAELLAALRAVVADFDDYPTHDRTLRGLLDNARAAIAKATGQ